MTAKQTVQERHEAIIELVKKWAVRDQKQLVELLEKHYGIETNQAVISRDIRKLGLFKATVKGVLVYRLPEKDVRKAITHMALLNVRHNETTIVIETYPGLAPFVGDRLDEYEDLGILGCIAGENVVFVAPKSIKNIKETCQAICECFQFKMEIKS